MIRETNQIRIIDVPEQWDMDTLKATFNEVVEGNIKAVAVNLERVSFIDSAGLALFVALYKSCEEKNIRLSLFNLQPYFRKLLQITKLDKILPLYTNESDVLNAIS